MVKSYKQIQETHHQKTDSHPQARVYSIRIPDILRNKRWRIDIDIDRISGGGGESAICRHTVRSIRQIAKQSVSIISSGSIVALTASCATAARPEGDPNIAVINLRRFLDPT